MITIKAIIECVSENPEYKTEHDSLRYLFQINDWKMDRVFTFYHYTTREKREGKNTAERKVIARALRSKHSNLWHHYDLVKNPPT